MPHQIPQSLKKKKKVTGTNNASRREKNRI